MTTTLTRHGDNAQYFSDWHTPDDMVLRSIKEFYNGEIHLDPASDERANEIIQAQHYFTKEDNGLEKSWSNYGNHIFLNYPGGKTGSVSNSTIWFNKALYEFTVNPDLNIIILLFSVEHICINPGMLKHSICFLRNRIKFSKYNELGNLLPSKPTHSNALLYIGNDYNKRFKDVFSNLGGCI